ncbi:DUF6868 family protein [Luteimonas sp. e5]
MSVIDLQMLRDLLGICVLLNYMVLLLWFGVIVFARDGLQRLHGRWFALDRHTFDALHYGAMAAYKVGILLFGLVPWVALTWLLSG